MSDLLHNAAGIEAGAAGIRAQNALIAEIAEESIQNYRQLSEVSDGVATDSAEEYSRQLHGVVTEIHDYVETTVCKIEHAQEAVQITDITNAGGMGA